MNAQCRAGGALVGSWWSLSCSAVHHLLSASLTLLSCPSCPSGPCPLCPGATLPSPGGSGGSVNGYHTCKGELAVSSPFLSMHFHSLGTPTPMGHPQHPSRWEMSLAMGWEFSLQPWRVRVGLKEERGSPGEWQHPDTSSADKWEII